MKYTFLLLLLFPFLTSAQDSIPAYILDSVVVSSLRGETNHNLPYSINILDAEEIQRGRGGLSLSELSLTSPGLLINNRNNFSLGDKIIIRGIGARSSFGVRGIKIIYDGIPLTMPDGQSQLNNLDLYSAGTIEIIKGPASALYGNSSGGVINISSEKPGDKIFSAAPQVLFGSFGLRKYSIKLSGTAAGQNYLLSLNKLDNTGFREHSSSSFFNLNAVVKSTLSPGLYIKNIFNFFNAPYLLNPGSLNKFDADNNPGSARTIIKQQGAGEKLTHAQAGTTLNYIRNNFSLESSVYYAIRSTLNPIPGRIIDLQRSAGGLRTILSFRFNDLFTVNAGTDIEFQKDYRKECENKGLKSVTTPEEEIFKRINYGMPLLNQKENVFNSSPFFFIETSISNNIIISGGLRFDYYRFKAEDYYLNDLSNDSGKRIMKSWSPAAGITYKAAPGIKVYGNFSTSFQTPTTNELSNRPDGSGGFNSSLDPEKVYSYETGGQINMEDISIDGAFFYMNFKGLIIPYQVPGAAEETYFKNAGKADNTGIELSAVYSLKRNIKLSANYTLNNFRYTDYPVSGNTQLKNNKVPGVPQHRIVLSARCSFNSFYVSADAGYTSGYYTNDYNGIPPGSVNSSNIYFNEGYAEINLRAGYFIKLRNFEFEIFAGVNNLLNDRYNSSIVPNAAGERFFEPAPPINFYVGIKINY